VPERVLFDLTLLPRWELISELRRCVVRCLERLKMDEDQAYAASLATHELLENAVKYGRGDVRVRIVLSADERNLKHVAVENVTTKPHIVNLKRAVGDLKQVDDPMRSFTERMGKSAGSGLGLARIAAEGALALKCTVRANRVAVTAEAGGARG
jgi:anti-sigma regulatory factor (Ser/Thr protein kinase)